LVKKVAEKKGDGNRHKLLAFTDQFLEPSPKPRVPFARNLDRIDASSRTAE
jgi:hypothetical protein